MIHFEQKITHISIIFRKTIKSITKQLIIILFENTIYLCNHYRFLSPARCFFFQNRQSFPHFDRYIIDILTATERWKDNYVR